MVREDWIGVRAMTEASSVEEAAGRLLDAAVAGNPCRPVRDVLGADVAAAYAVQHLLVDVSLLAGRRIVGRKVGLTSKAVQAQLGVDQPDFGYLFDDMRVAAGADVAAGRLLQARIEAEVAFIVGRTITRPDEDEIIGAIAGVATALEIVDSRIEGWDITLTDTVADNASCGLFVLGEEMPLSATGSLSELTMTMAVEDGRVVSAGRGFDCLGDPMRAAVWVARTALAQGRSLGPGDVILSGALGPMVSVTPGETYMASVTDLGTVSVHFEE
jgi:2-keto-4-pentenoate hydratase